METNKENKKAKFLKPDISLTNKSNINSDNKKDFENVFIKDIYLLLFSLGKGAFGKVYFTWNFRDEIECATKIENQKNNVLQLKYEFTILCKLLKINPTKTIDIRDYSGENFIPQDKVNGIPRLYGFGVLPYGNHYLTMECLGPSLISLFNYCGKRFSLMTISLIALQIIEKIEYFHSIDYIHRDIKPENFLLGLGANSNIIYIIDYGLSKQFRDPNSRKHISYREGRSFKGTARYASINTHLGIEQSRRDDLESFGYMLIYFSKGFLPWQGQKGNNQNEKIFEKKIQTPLELLCHGLPEEIFIYMTYVRELKFEDKPDYEYLKGLFINILKNISKEYKISENDFVFDWMFDSKNKIQELFLKSTRVKANDFFQDTKKNSLDNKLIALSNKPKLVSVEESEVYELIDTSKKNPLTSKNDSVSSSDIVNNNNESSNEESLSNDATVSVNQISLLNCEIANLSMSKDVAEEKIDDYIYNKILNFDSFNNENYKIQTNIQNIENSLVYSNDKITKFKNIKKTPNNNKSNKRLENKSEVLTVEYEKSNIDDTISFIQNPEFNLLHNNSARKNILLKEEENDISIDTKDLSYFNQNSKS